MRVEEPMLDVRVTRRLHAGLDLDVDLRLESEVGVLFGPSGAGKTTILRLISGLERPDRGSIRLGGSILFDRDRRIDQPLRLRRIGMIFQDDLLFPHLSVAGNIGFGLRMPGRSARDERLREVAALCGVEGLLKRRPASLSGGERQRVGLARALAPRPRLLLCDEPFSALDLPNRHALIARLRAVQRAERLTVLYVTHSPAEAIELGTRLFLLEAGRIAAEGPPLDLLARPRAGSAWRLEGMLNVFSGRIECHDPTLGATRLRLDEGPELLVPRVEAPPGSKVVVEIRADDILLAIGSVGGISAQNLIPATVDRILSHDGECEVIVRTGSITWIVSVVAGAVDKLALAPGSVVRMVIKARSCHTLETGK